MEMDEIYRIGSRAIISIIAMAAAGAVFWAARRQRVATGVKRPKKLESFISDQPPETILEILRREMGRFGYRIEETVPSDADLLLSEAPTAFSFGFYYPIYLKPVEKYQTRVEVGIESKAI